MGKARKYDLLLKLDQIASDGQLDFVIVLGMSGDEDRKRYLSWTIDSQLKMSIPSSAS